MLHCKVHVGWYVDCKNMHGVKNIKHAGMQLGCKSSIQEVADSQCGCCPTHITVPFRKPSFNSPFMYVRIQPAAQQTSNLCSKLLSFPRFYALFVRSQIMHVTTMYTFLDFTLSMFSHFIFLVLTTEFTQFYISFFSSQNCCCWFFSPFPPQLCRPNYNVDSA
jgi:hypothetical protein